MAHDLMLNRSLQSSTWRKSFGSDRDLTAVLGYKRPDQIKIVDFEERWRRQGTAGRAVDLLVDKTWPAKLGITGPDDEESPFKAGEDLAALDRRLRLLHQFARLDRLAMLGEFAIAIIGVAEEVPNLEAEVQKAAFNDVIYFQPYGQRFVTISDYETDLGSPRYGQPTMYRVDMLADPRSPSNRAKTKVHHSRVVHVARGGLHNDVQGTPFLLSILDDLMNLDKVVGGTAEMFWQSAARALIASIETGAELTAPQEQALHDDLVKWYHQLVRVLTVQGVKIEALPVNTPDPTGIVRVLEDLIAARTGIPRRIFFGSERGELASSQDRETFAELIDSRRSEYAEPLIVRGTIDRLQQWGALAEGEYDPVWPSSLRLSELDQSEVWAKNARALKDSSVAGDPGEIAEREERRVRIGLPEE